MASWQHILIISLYSVITYTPLSFPIIPIPCSHLGSAMGRRGGSTRERRARDKERGAKKQMDKEKRSQVANLLAQREAEREAKREAEREGTGSELSCGRSEADSSKPPPSLPHCPCGRPCFWGRSSGYGYPWGDASCCWACRKGLLLSGSFNTPTNFTSMVHNDYCDRAVNVAKPIRIPPRPQPAFQTRNGDWSNPAHAKDERYVPAVILKDRDQQQAALNRSRQENAAAAAAAANGAEAPGVRAVPSTRLGYEVAMQPTVPMTGAPVPYAEILAAVELTGRISSEAFYAYFHEEPLRIQTPPFELAAPANADAGALEVAAEDSEEEDGGETGLIPD